MKNYSISYLVLVILLVGCQNLSWLPQEKAESVQTDPDAIKNGLVKNYRDNGMLHSAINYVNNTRHGIAKRYSKNGKLLFEIPYDSGRKHGVSKMFYEDGKVRRSTEYVRGMMTGVRKSFFTNGSISSQITYKDDMPANDLKEYMKSGKEKSKYPALKVEGIDRIGYSGEYVIKMYFTKNNKRAEFYIGELVNGQFLDETKVEPTAINEEGGYITYNVPVGMFTMQKVHIIGKLKTARGNPLIRSTVFNLAVQG